MRPARPAAAMAALLLSSTALLAQDGVTAFDSVILDVGGTPVQVSVAQASEACGLDAAEGAEAVQ